MFIAFLGLIGKQWGLLALFGSIVGLHGHLRVWFVMCFPLYWFFVENHPRVPIHCSPLCDLLFGMVWSVWQFEIFLALALFVVKQWPYWRSPKLQSLHRKVMYFLTKSRFILGSKIKSWSSSHPPLRTAESSNSSIRSNEVTEFTTMFIYFLDICGCLWLCIIVDKMLFGGILFIFIANELLHGVMSLYIICEYLDLYECQDLPCGPRQTWH